MLANSISPTFTMRGDLDMAYKYATKVSPQQNMQGELLLWICVADFGADIHITLESMMNFYIQNP